MIWAEWVHEGEIYRITEYEGEGLQAKIWSESLEGSDWLPLEREVEIEDVVNLLCARVKYYEILSDHDQATIIMG